TYVTGKIFSQHKNFSGTFAEGLGTRIECRCLENAVFHLSQHSDGVNVTRLTCERFDGFERADTEFIGILQHITFAAESFVLTGFGRCFINLINLEREEIATLLSFSSTGVELRERAAD